MTALKYKVITSKKQYNKYCYQLEEMVGLPAKNKAIKEEIALVTLLIEKWDREHSTFNELDPVQLLISLMKEHAIKAKDLSDLLQVSKGYVSDVLNYKKGFSKDVTRKLSEHFKINQEGFNREYKLVKRAVAEIAR